MQIQPLAAKLGEVKYRAKIVNQQLGKGVVFENEPTACDFQKILEVKLKDTEKIFDRLQKAGFVLSPYLEIGSEHCLRPALLETKFGEKGLATDISFHSLTEAPSFIKKFQLTKIPMRICCDAYLLPFKSNSFPFIFIYETLHHFPNPKPVLEEVKRVLAPGGICLIGADPIKQSFQLRLWRRPSKLRLWEKFLKTLLILPFISHIGKTEVDHGILEEAFTLDVWQRALAIFDQVEVTMRAFPFGPSETVKKNTKSNWLVPGFLTNMALLAFGGGLQALCHKKGQYEQSKISLDDLLICPNCLDDKKEISLKKEANFICPRCQTKYFKYKGVLVLLERNLAKKILC